MLKIDRAKFDPIEKSDFPEIVERKGVGHPDSVCDAAARNSAPPSPPRGYDPYVRVSGKWHPGSG